MSQTQNTLNPIALDIKQMIDTSRENVAIAVNSEITLLYWKIGKRINEEILGNERAEYGKRIVISLSKQLTEDYGKGWGKTHLNYCIQFAEIFPDEQIVHALRGQLSWTHLRTIITVDNPLKREFYIEMCKLERWSSRQLQERIQSMLFERTAISKKPDELIEKELRELREENKVTPDLVFRSPLFLDFLGLKDKYSEKNLEDAVLSELEYFILELGQGFSFIERQKSMVIDGEDFKLDLLFYHRKLRRLVAVELKLGKFKAAYKGQMELYLRWLEKYDMQENEEMPIGLILCAEGNREQIELLQLDKSGIKIAEYLTALPSQELLQQKLHKAVEVARSKMENEVR
ncbi:MAG TPA: PDDEXK nuclease domain-containing protein [Pedobacter sp.]|uniref:PDDEXK nuclease domain-containing protein n=1 Tax=Pedobacter sp. TaxID=1411316 RepID=UPI002B50D937|nr:PDDEXK nuclease domain-containing protein [Pedobacter sp.]HMI05369.1 PDDEXK nuclease domain-containing protein [Pedobacter sp.]